MDTTRFDRIAKTFAHKPERRDVLRLLGLAAFGASGLSLLGTAEAKKKHKRKKHKKKKKGTNCNGKCGGSCPRCRAGSTCDSRDDCTTALCVDDVCTEPVNNTECGKDSDNATNCATRDTDDGEKACTKINCTLFSDGTCDDCKGEELCCPINGGADGIECCLPCGA